MTTGERGNATVMGAGMIVVLVLILQGALWLGAAVIASHRARSAADLAALAAAARLTRPDPGPDPCTAARGIAVAHGARLSTCAVAPDAVTVSVDVPVGRWPGVATASARAGPPPPSPDLDLSAGSSTTAAGRSPPAAGRGR